MIYGIILIIIIVAVVIAIVMMDYLRFTALRKHKIKNLYKMKTSLGNIAYIDLNSTAPNAILFCTSATQAIDAVFAFRWLTKSEYRIICIDRPAIDLPNSYMIHADIYHEVLQGLGVTQVAVFGVSMGGITALAYTKKYGATGLLLWSAVTKKCTVNIKSANSWIGKLVRFNKCKDLTSYLLVVLARVAPTILLTELFEAGAEVMRKDLKIMAKTVAHNKESKAELIAMMTSMAPKSLMYEKMICEFERVVTLEEDWSSIRTQCLAIYSALDASVSLDNLTYIEQTLSNIEAKVMTGAGHYIWWGSDYAKIESLKFLKECF